MTFPKIIDSVPSPNLSLKQIVSPILKSLNVVEEKLKEIGEESEGILKESSAYVLSSGGKRLRAALVLFCASITNGKGPKPLDAAVEIATAVELIHSATLVHDDIIDRAVLRRLKPTVNVRFGEEVSVLLGDFLYAKAFEIIAQVGKDSVTRWMAETTQKMCQGELDQLKHRYRSDLSLDEYLSFIERKTATLIATCSRSGAHLAEVSNEQQDALYAYGLYMGISFQMIDDLLDVIGMEKKLGKTVHTDLGNGKMTLPLILLMETLSGSEKKEFHKKINSLTPDWKAIQTLIQKHKIVEQTERFANEYFLRANQSLQSFGPAIRIPLENLSRFMIARDY